MHASGCLTLGQRTATTKLKVFFDIEMPIWMQQIIVWTVSTLWVSLKDSGIYVSQDEAKVDRVNWLDICNTGVIGSGFALGIGLAKTISLIGVHAGI